MGIDEAGIFYKEIIIIGRGPALGPLVYGTCLWPKEFSENLSKLGFDDSKKLSEEDRDTLFVAIKRLNEKLLFFLTKSLSAEVISNKMLSVSNE